MDTKRFEPLPEAEFIGFTSRNPAKKAIAEEMGVRWSESVDEIIRDQTVDAAFIATNNLTHTEIALKLIHGGKHCIVEKPLATSLDDAQAIYEAAKQSGVSVTINHMMLQNAYNKKAAQLVTTGTLGDVKELDLHIEFLLGATEEERTAWRCFNPDERGGPVGDTGSHCLYMAEFLVGSPITKVACTFTPATLPINAENGAYIRVEFENGARGVINVAFNRDFGSEKTLLTNLGYEIYGTKGIIRTYGALGQLSGHPDEPIPLRLLVDDFRQIREEKVTDITNIYRAVIAQHAQSILNNALMNIEEAIHNLQLVLAAYESAQQQGTVQEIR
jgi:predicted dehydrogenase